VMRYAVAALGLAALSFAATACSSPTDWRNSDPHANWNHDLYECTRARSISTPSNGHSMVDLCLRSRGWYPVPQVPTPPLPTPPAQDSKQPSTEAKPKDARPCPAGEYWSSKSSKCTKIGEE